MPMSQRFVDLAAIGNDEQALDAFYKKYRPLTAAEMWTISEGFGNAERLAELTESWEVVSDDLIKFRPTKKEKR